jgi:hypothetical protein
MSAMHDAHAGRSYLISVPCRNSRRVIGRNARDRGSRIITRTHLDLYDGLSKLMVMLPLELSVRGQHSYSRLAIPTWVRFPVEMVLR